MAAEWGSDEIEKVAVREILAKDVVGMDRSQLRLD